MKDLDIRIAIAKSLGIRIEGNWIHVPATQKEPAFTMSLNLLPHWDTDVKMAISLCAEAGKDGFHITIERWPSGGWEVTFGSQTESHYAPKDSLPLAICEAYLRMKGLWKDEETT